MITDYEYERYFYTGSHRKCLLFVEQDANVTIVAGKPPQITKTGGTPLIITNDNILQEKFELQENFNSSENWAFGSVEPSAISFDIREDGSIPILRDRLLRLYLYFDDNSSTLLYIGTYYIDEDELSDDSKSRTISGYDMIQSIRDVDIIDMYRGLFNAHEEPDPEDPEQKIWVPGREKITVKEARDKFFAYIADKENGEGIPVKQETVELPNDNFQFAFDVDTEALSGGQFLEDICEINGRYGHLGRKLSTASATKNYQIFQYIRVERYDEPGQRIGNELRLQGMMKGLYQTLSIGKIRVYNRDSVRLAGYDEGYYKTKMSTYNIYDNILIDDLTKSKTQEQVLKAMMKNIYDSVRYRKYVPFTAKFPADLCREVGDRITLYSDIDLQIDEDNPKSFKTLIFQRRITGIQNMIDEYSAKGDKKLPAFGDYSSSSGYSAKSSRSGYSSGSYSKEKELTDGEYRLMDMTTDDFVAYLHNVGIELLDEPSECLVEYVRTGEGHHVELSWKDPEDISTYKPHPCDWAGTVVIRKEDNPPKWRWDGTEEIVDSTTRDEYLETPFVDDTIEENKVYYYGIYPYYVYLDDQDHPRRHYTWTKIYRITTYMPMPIPVLSSLSASGTSITAHYEIPAWSDGSYTSCKLVYKKGAIPTSVTDGTAVNISTSATSKEISGLDELSKYYFVIYLSDGNTTNTSEPLDCMTSRDEGYNFAYTGSIQTFTAPKTGIYQLETWGAQGGNAEDSENELTARGGYGAYAKGEVLLVQGETIYIGVGGQDGFNGGTGYDYISWLDKYTFDNIGEKELVQLSDFSLIPSSITTATSEASANLSSLIPTEPVDLGDITYSMDHKATTYTKFVDSDYLEIGAGKVTVSGTDYHYFQIINKLDNYKWQSGYENFVWDNGYYPNFVQTYQLGIVLDKENQRGYLIRYSYAYNGGPSANGKYMYVYGMKTQNTGVDVIWETFKDQI